MTDNLDYPTPNQRQILWTSLTTLAVISLLAMAALVFFGFLQFLEWSYPILLPIGLAMLISLLLEPGVDFLQHKMHFSRVWATLLVTAVALLLLALFFTLALPPLIDQTGNFIKNDLPRLVQTGTSLITNQLATWPEAQTWVQTNLGDWKTSVPQAAGKLAYNISTPLGQAFGFILGFGFVPIYAFYFLVDKEEFVDGWKKYVPLRRDWLREEVITLISQINDSLVNFFRGQIIVAACNGVLTFLGLLIIDIPNSLFLGFLTGALSIVPFLGVISGLTPALLLGIMSSPPGWSPWIKPMLVLGVFTLVQVSESIFITPRVQGHATGLHPLVIILGILFWSSVLPGLLGPIVAVPLTCAAMVIFRRYLWQDAPPEKTEAQP